MRHLMVWALNNSVAMLNQGNDAWKVTVQLKADEGFKFLTDTDLWFIPVSCW